jgi:hypothetical protein
MGVLDEQPGREKLKDMPKPPGGKRVRLESVQNVEWVNRCWEYSAREDDEAAACEM